MVAVVILRQEEAETEVAEGSEADRPLHWLLELHFHHRSASIRRHGLLRGKSVASIAPNVAGNHSHGSGRRIVPKLGEFAFDLYFNVSGPCKPPIMPSGSKGRVRYPAPRWSYDLRGDLFDVTDADYSYSKVRDPGGGPARPKPFHSREGCELITVQPAGSPNDEIGPAASNLESRARDK